MQFSLYIIHFLSTFSHVRLVHTLLSIRSFYYLKRKYFPFYLNGAAIQFFGQKWFFLHHFEHQIKIKIIFMANKRATKEYKMFLFQVILKFISNKKEQIKLLHIEQV